MNPGLVAFLTSWSWEPPIVLGLALAGGLYAAGWRRLRRRGGGRRALPSWRAWCYGAGLGAIALALLSPIAAFTEFFFFMHMIQHLLLMLVVPPLLWLGAPLLPALWAFPRRLRRGIGGLIAPERPLQRVFHVLTHAPVAAALYIGTVALWHVPSFYDAAQGRTVVHDLEHLLFVGTALLYWWPLVHPAGGRRRLPYLAALPYLVLGTIEGSVIGIILTFADQPLYATYRNVPRVWGLSALEDQQIAGLIMWIPGGVGYLIPILALLGRYLSEEERQAGAPARHGAAGRPVAEG